MSDHRPLSEENALPRQELLESILAPANLNRAWKRVKANGGAAGMDGMSLAAFPAFARKNMPRIVTWLREGRYKPAPVKRVWIPKPDGSQRPLGVPTVLDRVIQQAIAQVLTPLFEADFSEHSYGFREGRGAHDALGHLSEAAQEGYRWAVDCDLKSFFDTVHHDRLIHQLRGQIADRGVLRLIGKYLRAGVRLPDGTTEPTARGIPQGGPLSPLLANVMLDPLDRQIEAMGLPFARYADDFLILTRSKAEALEALAVVREVVEGTLKLIVNEDKTKVAPLRDCAFLGFHLSGSKIRRSEKAAIRFKTRIRELTARSRGVSMRQRIKELRRYCVGWFHYFKVGLGYGEVVHWDQWIRRRVRLCHWKDWKRPGTRRKRLLELGADPKEVHLVTRSRKGYWRLASNRIVQQALDDPYLKSLGLPSLKELWIAFKYGSQATA